MSGVDWSLSDLHLRCRDVRLRGMREADLPHPTSVTPRLEMFPELSDVETNAACSASAGGRRVERAARCS
jgi:hypothetical protein